MHRGRRRLRGGRYLLDRGERRPRQRRRYLHLQVQANSASVWLIPARGGPTSQAVDENAYSDQATSGTTYRWDATSQQYIYNWSTKGAATGYYYRISVQLDDGETYTVNVGLR